MKGHNKLIVNSATAIEAFQEYLDGRYEPNIKVTDVTEDKIENCFIISVQQVTEEK